jgi:hypothetical protein
MAAALQKLNQAVQGCVDSLNQAYAENIHLATAPGKENTRGQTDRRRHWIGLHQCGGAEWMGYGQRSGSRGRAQFSV